ncbi:hypothetical protein HMPREF9318_01800 [Streptococcus urinalis FB127-CNA-2]|nr:hypothetical protein [Streptococcus urinalis]EKS18301.1 hypothetical protein HMPREF9318_01800 [Streptococcus urinalis FB127-CNA-2]MEE3767199.1 hypothetical protein [Streptococcus agalactiae]VEF32825.1 Uncharacterised protein [Streptococcus urinalis]
MEIKDRLRVKLIRYCLFEIRNFILSQYPPDLMEEINKKLGDRDVYDHGMLWFTLINLLPFNESISEKVDDILKDLVDETRDICKSKEFFMFIVERIPYYDDKLQDLILEE